MAAQMMTSSTVLSSTQRCTAIRPSTGRRTCALRAVAAVNQEHGRETAVPRVQRAMQAGAKVLVSLAAAQLAVLPLSGAALALTNDDANMGPNEVTSDLLGSFPGSNNPFDKAMPGRSGETFGEDAPGQNDTGAVDEQKVKEKAEEGAAKASSIVDKIRDALPFGTMSVFDLALTDADANMGPNEVDKRLLGSFQDSDNPYDTAMPGRTGETFGASKPGENDTGAVDVAKVEEKKAEAAGIVQKIKDALPFSTLPIFDVAVDEQTANLGPNEVTQKTLGSLPGASKFDQAAPGRAGTTSNTPKAGQSVKNAAKDVVGDAKKAAGDAAGKSKKFFGLF